MIDDGNGYARHAPEGARGLAEETFVRIGYRCVPRLEDAGKQALADRVVSEGLERLRVSGNQGPWVAVATAHPAKFESVVEPLTGTAVPVPPALERLLQRPSHADTLAADSAALRQALGG